jgi:site-specific DNA-cytosine methylase
MFLKYCAVGHVGVMGFHLVLQVQRMLPSPIRVLSLFDGISTGLYVLRDKLGIKVDEYFSSEVDGDALTVQRSRYFGQMTCLGDVKNVTSEMLECLGRIDLLLGGSPCDQLSRVNPYRLGLHSMFAPVHLSASCNVLITIVCNMHFLDPASSGNLFFDFVRIRNFLFHKAKVRREPFFWFFENTAHMDRSTRTDMEMYTEIMRPTAQLMWYLLRNSCKQYTFTSFSALGCRPVRCCSSSFLPVNRRRLFFGNIPLMEETSEKLSKHKQPQCLQSIVGPWRKAVVETVPTITTKSSSQLEGTEALKEEEVTVQ